MHGKGVAALRTVSDGSASMTNLFCLRSCALSAPNPMRAIRRRITLNVIFMVAVVMWMM